MTPDSELATPQIMLAAIALGANLPSRFGSPADTLREAVSRLGETGKVTAVSRFYCTEPVGYADQPRFTNAAALLETTLSPLPLLHTLLAIEAAMGRIRAQDTPQNGPRIIDLDLLLCFRREADGRLQPVTLQHPELTLPHTRMWERAFVMDPLREIARDIVDRY